MSSQETFSITTLQRMCARSEYLDESDIHMNDKTVSWDGNIIYYKTKKPASTGYEFLIPIQVKGKEYNTLPDSDSISYPVDINDLKNYKYVQKYKPCKNCPRIRGTLCSF